MDRTDWCQIAGPCLQCVAFRVKTPRPQSTTAGIQLSRTMQCQASEQHATCFFDCTNGATGVALQHGGRLQGGQNPLAGSRLQTKKRRLFLVCCTYQPVGTTTAVVFDPNNRNHELDCWSCLFSFVPQKPTRYALCTRLDDDCSCQKANEVAAVVDGHRLRAPAERSARSHRSALEDRPL